MLFIVDPKTDMVFAEVSKGYNLHICSIEEFANATIEEIDEMVANAISVKKMEGKNGTAQ